MDTLKYEGEMLDISLPGTSKDVGSKGIVPGADEGFDGISRFAIEIPVKLRKELSEVEELADKASLWYSHLSFTMMDLVTSLGGHSLILIQADSLLLNVILGSLSASGNDAVIHTSTTGSVTCYDSQIQPSTSVSYKSDYSNDHNINIPSSTVSSKVCPGGLNPLEIASETSKETSSLITTEKVDLMYSFIKDLQFLRLFYVFEKKLKEIMDCGTNFKLVFFDAFKPFFELLNHPIYWLCRQCLRLHLLKSSPNNVSEFKHWAEPDFTEFLRLTNPACFLLEDGSSFMTDFQQPSTLLKKAFNISISLISNTLCNQMNVALMYRMHIRGSKVMVMAVGTQFGFPELNLSLNDWLFPNNHTNSNVSSIPSSPIYNTDFSLLENIILFHLSNSSISEQLILSLKLLLLYKSFQNHIPISYRSHRPPPYSQWSTWPSWIFNELNSFFQSAEYVINEVNMEGNMAIDSIELVDFFDINIYLTFLYLCSSYANHSDRMLQEPFFGEKDAINHVLNSTWMGTFKQSEPFFPINLEDDLLTISNKHLNLPPFASAITVNTLDETFYDDFFSTLMPSVLCDYTSKLFKDPSIVQHTNQHSSQLVRPNSLLNIKLDTAKLEFEQFTEHSKSYKSRREQKNVHFLSVYAKSLGGAENLHFPIIKTDDHIWKESKQAKQANKQTKAHTPQKKAPNKLNKADTMLKNLQEDARKKKIKKDSEKIQELPVEKALGDSCEVYVQKLLDLTVGHSRKTNSFSGFPAINMLFETEEGRLQYLINIGQRMLTLLYVLKEDNYDNVNKENNIHSTQIAVYTARFVFDVYTQFENILEITQITVLLKLLINLNFIHSANNLLHKWRTYTQANTDVSTNTTADKKDDKSKGNKAKKGAQKDTQNNQKTNNNNTISSSKNKLLDDIFNNKYKKLFPSAIDSSKEMEFQLIHMAHLMERNLDSKADKRVKFKPDAWQRRILDIVDNYESALVHAPTSSGKTFICFYVMDLVLQYGDDEVVVYVSPSKSLMQQVQAEVYARFSNKSYEIRGISSVRTLNAIADRLKRDEETLRCQILVTVPYVFETLLMSSVFQPWVKRIKYIILDEMHCIGEEDSTHIWEHLFQLTPSPILAMSATIGNPNQITRWIQNCQQTDRHVHYISHKERFSDLYKYWLDSGNITPLHPVASLHFNTILVKGLTSDFSLTPLEAVTLYHCLVELLPNEDLSWLNPEYYFKGCHAVSKPQTGIYSRTLLNTFSSLIIKEKKIDNFVFNKLTQKLVTLHWNFTSTKDKETESKKITNFSDNSDVSTKFVCTNSYDYLNAQSLEGILKELRNGNLLPVLVFNFSRLEIQKMLTNLVTKLSSDQHAYYYGTEEAIHNTKAINQARLNAFKAKQKQRILQQKLQTSSREQKDFNDTHQDENQQDDIFLEDTQPPIDIADEYNLNYNFSDWKAMIQYSETLTYCIHMITSIKKISKPMKKLLLEGINRGIGMHHNGLPFRYRKAVEVLFRMGLLRVVFATGTLSLGIHMPCKSVIFAGDSIELNPLMYRQMSGRSGRRGFDLIGHVFFWCIPFKKVQYLVNSQLPILNGDFSVSTIQTLRMITTWSRLKFSQIHEKDQKEEILQSFQKYYQNIYFAPLFSSSLTNTNAKKIFFKRTSIAIRFNIEFLINMGIISTNGEFSPIVAYLLYLFEEESGIIPMCLLIASGALEKYIEETHVTRRPSALMHVFAYHFLPICASRSLSMLALQSINKRGTNEGNKLPLLTPLPPSINQFITYNNQMLLKHEINSLKMLYSKTSFDSDDYKLPFSNYQFEHTNTNIDTLPSKYTSQIIKNTIRSPFTAISGFTDDEFNSSFELFDNIRRGAYTGIDSCPEMYTDMLKNSHKKDVLTLRNSYAFDFFNSEKTTVDFINLPWTHALDASTSFTLMEQFSTILNKFKYVFDLTSPNKTILSETIETVVTGFEAKLRSIAA